MPIGSYVRIACMAALALWGIANLLGVWRVREAPLLQKARLLAGMGGIWMALALLAVGQGSRLLALLFGAAGLVSGAGWLYIIFKQSLNNTTM